MWSKGIKLAVLAVVVAMSIISPPRAVASTKRFMVGPYQGLMYGDTIDLHYRMTRWADSMKSSWAWSDLVNADRAKTLMNWRFKLLLPDSAITPGHRGDMAQEYYCVWQTDPASVPPWFDGQWQWRKGRSLIDAGDTVWSVSAALGDTRGWVLGSICHSLRQGGLLLIAEPMGHVSVQEFDETIAAATRCGIEVVHSPCIRRCHARLLRKTRNVTAPA